MNLKRLLEEIDTISDEMTVGAVMVFYSGGYAEVSYDKKNFAPVTRKMLSDLLSTTMADENNFIKGEIPERLKYISLSKAPVMAWVFKKQNKTLTASGKKIEIEFPNSLFVLRGERTLMIYHFRAFRGNKTVMYRTLLPNSAPSVCWGNVKIPVSRDIKDIISAIENAYFNSEFSGTTDLITSSLEKTFSKENIKNKTTYGKIIKTLDTEVS